MIVEELGDVDELPEDIEQVRLSSFLTKKLASRLLEQCPNLERVILAPSVRERASNAVINSLKSEGIDVTRGSRGPGRPVEYSRRQLAEMRRMREEGVSYEKIAEKIGVSKATAYRALTGDTKFKRWREDFNNGGREEAVWMVSHDANPIGRKLADRHYSRKTEGAKFFCGPGEKLVLMTPDHKALFVWRKNKYRWDEQKGIECSLFRNESAVLSSALIEEAVRMAREKWPGARLFTYVNPEEVKSFDPGYCFKCAGWKVVGENKDGRLIVLEAPEA